MDFWLKIRKYVILWALMFFGLVTASLVTYHEAILQWLHDSVIYGISGLLTLVIMVYAIISMIRGVFR